jgi:UDP-N-acetylglucosamine/UDP-N-acetylgalactosamine diphosphorylase
LECVGEWIQFKQATVTIEENVSSEETQKSGLLQQLEPHGQSHLLRFWDDLDGDQRQRLADQIESFDFGLIRSLASGHSETDHWEQLAERASVPPAITLGDFADPASFDEADALGRAALESGKVGMILVAGGQGSRLGFDHPKGMYPIGPVSNRTLYQFHFEQVLGRSKQFGATIPLYVMTSPPTHAETTQFLTENDFFGISPEDVKIFCQGVMPAVDGDGKLLLEECGKVFVSPDGHGGTLAALASSGCLADATARGVEHLFYGQVDNPLVQICEPALIGYHLKSGSEMTSQVVRKNEPSQKVGNVVEVDGKVQIIEYSDLPQKYAEQRLDDGSLKLWAGSIAVHIFSTEFLVQSSGQADSLPFHHARKKVPFVDDAGESVVPDEPNAVKFERFIFDLLPLAKNAIVCEVGPADGFCAVKNASPAKSETPEHVKAAISDLHQRWLTQAGVTVADGIQVEISPLFAPDAQSLVGKLESGTTITETTYFQ